MTIDVDLGLRLEASLGKLSHQMEKDAADRRQERETALARVPSIIRLQQSGVIATPTAPYGLSFGGPDVGFEWVVRRMVVGGFQWSTTAAGTAEVYITGISSNTGTGSSHPIATVRTLSDMVDQSASLPNKAFYGREQFVVKESESLVVVIVGGTAGQQYTAAIGLQVVRTVAKTWGASQGM